MVRMFVAFILFAGFFWLVVSFPPDPCISAGFILLLSGSLPFHPRHSDTKDMLTSYLGCTPFIYCSPPLLVSNSHLLNLHDPSFVRILTHTFLVVSHHLPLVLPSTLEYGIFGP